MQTKSTYHLPYPLNRIEVRTIRRQKIENEAVGMLFTPLSMQYGMMVLRVVCNQNHFDNCRGPW